MLPETYPLQLCKTDLHHNVRKKDTREIRLQARKNVLQYKRNLTYIKELNVNIRLILKHKKKIKHKNTSALQTLSYIFTYNPKQKSKQTSNIIVQQLPILHKDP